MGKSIVIIGGGVVGLGVGWQLASRGWRVTLCERDVVGAGASTAAAGMLAPTAEVNFEEEALLRLNHASRELYPDFVRELEAEAGVDVDYRTDGTLVVGLDRDDSEALERLLVYQHSLGLHAERLSGEAAREREPGLSPNVHSAVWCPGDHQVDPVLLIKALRVALEQRAGLIREQTEVEEVLLDGGVARGVRLVGGEVIEADRVLVAAGAWVKTLGGLSARQKPRIRPVRGQMLALRMPDGQPTCTHVVRSPDAYIVPKSDGRLIIGATMEERGFDANLTAGGVFELLRGAWEAVPGTYDLDLIGMWTGFRPMTLSNDPVLGPSRSIEQLWFGAGHGRNGILLTPLTARLLARSIDEDRILPELEEFSG